MKGQDFRDGYLENPFSIDRSVGWHSGTKFTETRILLFLRLCFDSDSQAGKGAYVKSDSRFPIPG
jgi:hypothetical protein